MQSQSQPYSARQGYAVMAMFLIGSTVILSPGREAKGDIWLAVIVAFVMALPLAALYGRLIQIYPGKTFYEMQLDFFGPVFGRLTIAVYTWYSLHTGAIILREFTEFIQINSFPYVEQYLFALPLGILCIWCVKSGIGTLGRWCILIAPIFLFLLVFNSLLSIQQWDFKHIYPVMYEGVQPIMSGAFRLLGVPFLEGPLLVLTFQPFQRRHKAIRMFVLSFLLAAVVLSIIFVRDIFVLGEPLEDALLFPAYEVVKLTTVGNFIQGLEVLAAVVFMTGYYVKLVVFLYTAVSGFTKLLAIDDYRKMAAPVGLVFVTFSLFVSPNINEIMDWVPAVFTYYSLPVGLFLPLVLWIIGEWRWRKRKRSAELTAEEESDTAPPPELSAESHIP